MTFEHGVPRFLEPDIANLFTPNNDWVVGVHQGVHNFDEPGERHMLVRRRVALGDVLSTHGALQGVMAAYPGRYAITYQVSDQYVEVLRATGSYRDVLSERCKVVDVEGVDGFVNLDGLLERDHNVGEAKINRVVRAWKHFFVAKPELLDMSVLKPVWDLTIPETDRAWAYRELDTRGVLEHAAKGKPVVAVAARAVQKPRNMKEGAVPKFTEMLVREHDAKVILIEHDPAYIWRGPGIEGFPKSTVLQAMALMQHCDVLCSMDSGAMWMGHCIPIPTVVWFGPTPPETKINMHPYYPEGIRGLRMWEWVGCPESCYEAASWCEYAYKCVKDPPEATFIEASMRAVMELVEWKRGQKAQ